MKSEVVSSVTMTPWAGILLHTTG